MKQEILARYINGSATPNERANVVEWLDSDNKNVHEYMALHKLHNISIMNQIESGEKNSAPAKQIPEKSLWKKIGIEIAKIAAIILIVFEISNLANTNEDYQIIYAPAGQRTEVILPDNSKVWLNSASRLKYPLVFNKKQREVLLDGEAYFEVAHNEKPFIVKTQKINVRVLGTEFNVRSYSNADSEQIDLLKGSIELSGATFNNETLLMKPQESVSIVNGKVQITKIKDHDYFKWKEGLLCFDNESVADIIKKLEVYYDIRIKVGKHLFLTETYSGKFRIRDGVEQVLKVLQLEYKFTYTKDNNLNLITIK